MVAGKAIDAVEVENFVEPAVIVIAHNAGFDRRFVERAFPIFVVKAWGCSISDVPWREEGFEGSRLAYLAMRHGFFFDGHRAADDCHAALEILARDLPVSGEPALKRLLDNARTPTLRLWAIGSPFEIKDILKARGYRWNAGENENPKSWYIDLSEDSLEVELAFLKEQVFHRDPDPRIDRITAFDRYSDRG
jgi:DNA polymerase-3 subunit epsilon